MKTFTLLGSLVAAAALTFPAAAHAAQYESFTLTDPSHAENEAEPATAGVDLVEFAGKRTDSVFKLTQQFRNLTAVDASRRYVGLLDPESSKGRLLEYRTTPSGKVQTAYYKITFGNGETQIDEASCRGAAIQAQRKKDRIVYTLPAKCYPGSNQPGAVVLAGAGRWTKRTWTNGSLADQMTPAQEDDQLQTQWIWDGSVQSRTTRLPQIF